MTKDSDRTFEVDKKKYSIVEPNGKQLREARKIYTRELTNCINENLLLRQNIVDVAVKKGIWSDEKEAEVRTIANKMDELTKTLENGGIELEDAKNNAMELINLRQKIMDIKSPLNELDSITAESIAESIRTDFLISECILDEGGKRCFKNLDDFYEKQNTPIAIVGSLKFNMLMYGLVDIYDNLPEYKFLKEFNFINDDGEDITEEVKPEKKPFLKDGKPIDGE